MWENAQFHWRTLSDLLLQIQRTYVQRNPSLHQCLPKVSTFKYFTALFTSFNVCVTMHHWYNNINSQLDARIIILLTINYHLKHVELIEIINKITTVASSWLFVLYFYFISFTGFKNIVSKHVFNFVSSGILCMIQHGLPTISTLFHWNGGVKLTVIY